MEECLSSEKIFFQNQQHNFFKGGFENAPYGAEAKAFINLVDKSIVRKVNVRNTSIETLHGQYANINVANAITIANIGTYQSFNVYPLSFIELDQGGGGYRARPTLDTYSFYNESYEDIMIITSCNIV